MDSRGLGLGAMPTFRPKARLGAKPRRGVKAASKPLRAKPRDKARKASAEIGEIVRKRAEAERAVAEARRSHARLREAIDILPQGIVFLDEEGRYILWNKKYAEIYDATADLYRTGVKLEDTLRIGRVMDLLNRARIQKEFEERVVADAQKSN